MYSIQELEKLSGVKAHTIRIWEKRYELLNPSRTSTNIREYSSEDLRKLLNVAALISAGGKISKLSKLSFEELGAKVDDLLQPEIEDEHSELFVGNLIAAGLEYNSEKFEAVFASALMKFGMKEMYMKVLLPTLVKIGLMWGKDEMMPAQEHMISNLIRQKLFAGIDALTSNADGVKYLLFLPPGEDHEIGLLLSYYLLKQKGEQVLFLGANVPVDSVVSSANETEAEILMLFIVRNWPISLIQKIITEISEKTQKKIIIAGSNAVISPIEAENIVKVSTIESFENLF